MNLGLLSFLEKILNQKGLISKGDNVAFYCPVCKKSDLHKKKLIVNLDENSKKFGWWRCWICKDENNMYGRNLVKLLYKLKVDRNKIVELYGLVDKNTLLFIKETDDLFDDLPKPTFNITYLPREYIPLYEPHSSSEYKYAKTYLIKRGITEEEILQYNIGYCEFGEYKNRIIIPSYDSNGHLNYFIGRSYYNLLKPKYKMPPIKNSNIVFFDQFISWNFPVLLCEGVFDAIAAKRNAIPIIGTNIPHSVKQRILSENVKDIFLALDMDAIKTSLGYIEKFISEGINVRLIEMNKKDPSELGFPKFINLYNSASIIDFEKIIKLKMKF